MEEFYDKFEEECNFLTHEFGTQTIIRVGISNGRRIAIKNVKKSEINVHRLLGNNINIVSFIDFIPDCSGIDTYYLIMEGIKDGLTLKQYVYSENYLTNTAIDKLNLVRQIYSGLEYIHSKGIIHHDFKEQNILVDLTENKVRMKICDFGVSEIADENGHGSDEWKTLGSLYNRAPEQTNSELFYLPVTKYIDIWASVNIIHLIFRTNPLIIYYFSPLTQRCNSNSPYDRPDTKNIITEIDKIEDKIKNIPDYLLKLPFDKLLDLLK